jgi:hypothetical protein
MAAEIPTQPHPYQIIQSYDLQETRQKGRVPVHIYLLCDPDTNEPRYIGQTINPLNRIRNHFQGLSVNPPLDLWFEELRLAGKSPRLDVVEIVNPGYGDAAEQRWIERLSVDGFKLLNFSCCRKRGREEMLRKHLLKDATSDKPTPQQQDALGRVIRAVREAVEEKERRRRQGEDQP